MSPIYIALFAAIGITGLIFVKIQKQTGESSITNAAVVSGIIGVITWLLLWYVLKLILPN